MAQKLPFLLRSAILLLTYHQYPSSLASKFDNETDRHALISFKSMLSDDSRDSLASWNYSIHFCNWRGVACSGRRHPQRVISLRLSSLGLAGSISSAVANLTFLTAIDLSINQFHGHIPQEIGRLSRLQHLNLSMNALEGGIPATLSSCSQLRNISMHSNMLTGVIPPGLSNCSYLQHINLRNNTLAGDIPPSLTNLTSLAILALGSNNLAGSIPIAIGNLNSLIALGLGINPLQGTIPTSIGKLSKLEVLDLSSNLLTGDIPSPLWNLSSLSELYLMSNNLTSSLPSDLGSLIPLIQVLYLYENQFHGPIPMSLSNASFLQRVEFQSNRFSGPIPPNIGALANLEWLDLGENLLEAEDAHGWSFLEDLTNCTSLRGLALDFNNLRGILPYSIANLSTKLEYFRMGQNEISGSIMPEIEKLVSLTFLYFSENLLAGPIPTSIGMLRNLRVLGLSYNKLSGDIPPTLGNLTELVTLDLDRNELSGTIPTSFGNCRQLTLMDISANRLTGNISKEILSISTLSIGLNLSHNSLTGRILSEVGNLQNLGFLDLSGNNLSGELPTSLGECQVLSELYLGSNSFNGIIPSSLSALKGIQVFDLSDNNLSGKIPDFLQDFSFLQYLNLSFNDFEGEVPRDGVFDNTSAVSVVGNNKLCGGNPQMHLPACYSQSSERRHKSRWPKTTISILGSSLFLFALFCFLVACCFLQKSRRKHQGQATASEQMRISYGELVRATNGFSTDNLIGSGSFSEVYKGIFHDDHDMKVVAVKVLKLHMQGASKSFITECETLRSIRHRNLVKIHTACSSIDFRGNEFKALIMEFMVKGSLDHWLHPEEGRQPRQRSLTLVERLNVAIDVASALDYLHNLGENPIIHCDLKPSNVLLDDDMTAHVADFGLARILKKAASKSSQYSTSSIGLKGTIGYVPPEYGVANKVSARGDLYSYGILLLEMFTAKSPTDDIFVNGLSLRKFVAIALPDQATDVIDERLLFFEDEEENDEARSINGVKAIEGITSALQIGIQCSCEKPLERPAIEVVIKELHKIRDCCGTHSKHASLS